MSRKTILILAGIFGFLIIIAAGWYLVSPLFIDNTVEEAFPFEVPPESEIASMSEKERGVLEAQFLAAVPSEETVAQLSEENQIAVAQQVDAAAEMVMMDKAMDDEMAQMDTATALLSGQFTGADSFHMGEGSATLFELGDQRVLRFEDFSVTNGPDLHVILSKHPAPIDRSDIGEDYIDLGTLKGNLGNQNYELPADIDISEYQSVVIYCVPFHVVFATATLQ